MTLKITIEGPLASGKTILANWLFVNLPVNKLEVIDDGFERARDIPISDLPIHPVQIVTKQTRQYPEQEPLGEEFTEVLIDNLDSLHED